MWRRHGLPSCYLGRLLTITACHGPPLQQPLHHCKNCFGFFYCRGQYFCGLCWISIRRNSGLLGSLLGPTSPYPVCSMLAHGGDSVCLPRLHFGLRGGTLSPWCYPHMAMPMVRNQCSVWQQILTITVSVSAQPARWDFHIVVHSRLLLRVLFHCVAVSYVP